MTDIDALATLKKAARLWESLAANESEKSHPDTRLMAEAMTHAADIAKDIAAIEDRRGLTLQSADLPEITVKFHEGSFHACSQCGYVEHIPEPLLALPAPSTARSVAGGGGPTTGSG